MRKQVRGHRMLSGGLARGHALIAPRIGKGRGTSWFACVWYNRAPLSTLVAKHHACVDAYVLAYLLISWSEVTCAPLRDGEVYTPVSVGEMVWGRNGGG